MHRLSLISLVALCLIGCHQGPVDSIGPISDAYIDAWVASNQKAFELIGGLGDRNFLSHTIERTTYPGPETPSRSAV